MRGKAILKVPGGKLVKAEVEHEQDRIVWAKITGDFFMHPEDALEKLEAALRDIEVGDLEPAVKRALEDVDLYGVSEEAIVEAIRGAVK
jgi:lipoate-protein ligase A